MNTCALISLLILFFSGLKLKYIEKENDFSFYISSSYRVQHLTTSSGYNEIFEVRNSLDTSKINYVISVAKATDMVNHSVDELQDYTYKNAFSQSCKCSIQESNKIYYKHFEAIVFDISATTYGDKLQGISVNTLKNGGIYNITFWVSEESFGNYQKEFQDLINSMEIYK